MLILNLRDIEMIKISDDIYIRIYKSEGNYKIAIKAPTKIPIKRVKLDSPEGLTVGFNVEKGLSKAKV